MIEVTIPEDLQETYTSLKRDWRSGPGRLAWEYIERIAALTEENGRLRHLLVLNSVPLDTAIEIAAQAERIRVLEGIMALYLADHQILDGPTWLPCPCDICIKARAALETSHD
jgi:hypothetical protein